MRESINFDSDINVYNMYYAYKNVRKNNYYSLRHFAIKSILNLIKTSPQTQEMDAIEHAVKN